ncbi:MAG: phosphoribosylanthranilate isomerase [Myxococcales bacterium]|nr:MAG: phosphoribosylanthranilate isomerase [Myxococcales bacterium]
MPVKVKICGVCSLEDASACVDAGADFLGLNFWRQGKRYCSPETAKRIVKELGSKVEIVGVFVDEAFQDIAVMRRDLGFDWVQLHGHESPQLLEALLPKAYKALRVQDKSILQTHEAFAGDYLLLDAYTPDVPGGGGVQFDWSLAREVAKQRNIMLAGGLRLDNVAQAVRAAKPFAVDVASGVEYAAGKKDIELVKAFVTEAKKAND